MDVQEILARATEAARVQRVFGEPIEREGVVVVPVALVRGGAGGGSGSSPRDDAGEGTGAGYGFVARPAGVYVIKDGDAHWQPALDVGRVILGGQAVAVAALLVLRSLLRRSSTDPDRRRSRSASARRRRPLTDGRRKIRWR